MRDDLRIELSEESEEGRKAEGDVSGSSTSLKIEEKNNISELEVRKEIIRIRKHCHLIRKKKCIVICSSCWS